MPKVTNDFLDQYDDLKRYSVGDDFPSENAERVNELQTLGYLSVEQEIPDGLPNAEQFAKLTAAEQKQILSGLGIEGDDSNPEKREALYAMTLKGVNPDDLNT